MSELIAMNVDNLQLWLERIAIVDPKAAIELVIELAQFSLPKLKAVAVMLEDNSKNPRSMSIEELQRIASEDT